MITNDNKKTVIILEVISSILGGISTLIIALITLSLAKKKNQKSLAKIIPIIPLIVCVFSGIVYPLFDELIIKIIICYVIAIVANILLIFIQNKLFDIETICDITPVNKLKINRKSILSITIFLVFVAVIVATSMLYSNSKQIEDTNGLNNYSLQTINDNSIKNLDVDFTAKSVSHGKQGDNSGVVGYDDYDVVRYSSKQASGVKVLQATKVTESNLTLTVDSNVVSGNCKVAIVVDNQIYSEFELNTKSTIELSDVQGKEVFVVLACESANLQLELTRTRDGSLS